MPDFQKFANVCLDLAERAPTDQKATLHEMAEVWLNLATEQLNKKSARDRTTMRKSSLVCILA